MDNQSTCPILGVNENVLPTFNPIEQAEQLIIVIAPHYESITGKLYLLEKKNQVWLVVQVIECSLGKGGMAWGDGLLDNQVKKGKRKQEGDKKTPAGIFNFGTAFGYAPKENVDFISMPYLCSESDYFCVDDVNSKFYNQIVSSQKVEKDWESSEDMKRKDELYEWGIFVEHNTPPKRLNGSCIHLHIWRGKGKPTAGCTATSKENMIQILSWLLPNKNPKLIQVTSAIYPRLKAWFHLPHLDI